MIKLKIPLNWRGGLLPPGTVIGLGDLEEKLIASGAAERYEPGIKKAEPKSSLDLFASETTRNDDTEMNTPPVKEPDLESVLEILQTRTKAELLEYVEEAEIEGISDKNKKNEIIAALIDALNNGLVLDLDAKDAD